MYQIHLPGEKGSVSDRFHASHWHVCLLKFLKDALPRFETNSGRLRKTANVGSTEKTLQEIGAPRFGNYSRAVSLLYIYI